MDVEVFGLWCRYYLLFTPELGELLEEWGLAEIGHDAYRFSFCSRRYVDTKHSTDSLLHIKHCDATRVIVPLSCHMLLYTAINPHSLWHTPL